MCVCKHHRVNQLRKHGGLLVVFATLAVIYSLLPIGTAFEFGGDEGYQLILGFMSSKGYALYQEIWSDQPPLFVMLLSGAFKVFGPSLLAARLIAVGFGTLLFVCFYVLVRQRFQTQTALLSTFFLLASPGVLLLSASVMQEVPTFALVLLSVCFLFQWQQTKHCGWLLISGAAMGLAAEIKFTAFLAVPAMLVEILFATQSSQRTAVLKAAVRNGFLWGFAVLVVLVLIGITWGKGSLESSWLAHASEQHVPGKPRAADFPIETKLFVNHVEAVLAACLGFALAVWQRRLRAVAFPLVLLLMALAVHLVHRPWWNYYYLHLAIPLAWLAGVAASETFGRTSELLSKKGFKFNELNTWRAITFCALAAMVLTWSLKRLEGGIKELRGRPNVADNPVVAKMREHSHKTDWVYAENPLYAFHAGLPMPPEVAMVTLKRFWSSQITTTAIVETCRRYQLGMLILPPATAKNEWEPFLGADFAPVTTDKKNVLYVAKGVTIESP